MMSCFDWIPISAFARTGSLWIPAFAGMTGGLLIMHEMSFVMHRFHFNEKYRTQKRGLTQKLLSGEYPIRHSCESRNPQDACSE